MSVLNGQEMSNERNHELSTNGLSVDQDQKEMTWGTRLSLLLVGFILFTDVFTDFFVMLDLNQYAYVEFHKSDFPDVAINTTRRGASYCDRATNSTDYKMEQVIQEDVSRWSVYTSLAFGLPAIVAAPLVSSISDVYGRKYCFLITICGGLLKNVMVSLGIYFEMNIQLFSIFLFVRGCTGSWVATLALSLSYTVDVVTSRNRSFAIVAIEMSIGIGIVVATLSSGYFISSFGFLVPVIASSVFSIFSVILVLFLLPESLQDQNRTKSVNICKLLRAALDFYIKKEKSWSQGKRWKFIIYITSFVLIKFGIFGKNNIEIYYQLGPPFCWNSVQI